MIFAWELAGFFFIPIFGTLAHFIYDWTNHHKTAAIFFAVNESTWENMKLAIGPSFLWLIIEALWLTSYDNFIFAKMIALLLTCLLIPTIFYTYMAIVKKHILAIDIFEFFFAIGCGQLASYYILTSFSVPFIVNYMSFIILILIAIIYLTSTFSPIKKFIFKDPRNMKYGLKAHMENEKHKLTKTK